MKRPTYFISARSPSADVLASELVLALREQFTKVDGFGITGVATARTKIAAIADLKDFVRLGIHDSAQWNAEAMALIDRIEQELAKYAPQVAILVGYSAYHERLAQYFKARQVPVVLYGMTPAEGWHDVDLDKLHEHIDRALGMFPRPGEFLEKSKVAYTYVGSPFRDRTDRVFISRKSLGLPENRPIVAFLPGTRLDVFSRLFPIMSQTAKELLKKKADLCLLLPLSNFIFEAAKSQFFAADKVKAIRQDSIDYHFRYEEFTVKRSMTLELLSLSQAAITGTGAATIECCLFGIPFIPLYHNSAEKEQGPHALVNQVWNRQVVPEFDLAVAPSLLADHILGLIADSPERAKMLKDFDEVKASLQGFAAENAAEIIGQEIAEWHVKKRVKTTKTA